LVCSQRGDFTFKLIFYCRRPLSVPGFSFQFCDTKNLAKFPPSQREKIVEFTPQNQNFFEIFIVIFVK
jgi:hypothetical protein